MSNSPARTWLRRLVAVAACASVLAGGSLTAGDTTESDENSKVRPGDVKWHADFDSACKAAAKSGRPVLLFQMMGNLDERFT
jgi:hypothetical protein